jgi:esterase/lipase
MDWVPNEAGKNMPVTAFAVRMRGRPGPKNHRFYLLSSYFDAGGYAGMGRKPIPFNPKGSFDVKTEYVGMRGGYAFALRQPRTRDTKGKLMLFRVTPKGGFRPCDEIPFDSSGAALYPQIMCCGESIAACCFLEEPKHWVCHVGPIKGFSSTRETYTLPRDSGVNIRLHHVGGKPFVFSRHPRTLDDHIACAPRHKKRITDAMIMPCAESALIQFSIQRRVFLFSSDEHQNIPGIGFWSGVSVENPLARNVIVYLHGGPAAEVPASLNPWLKPLVNAGFTLLNIDFPGGFSNVDTHQAGYRSFIEGNLRYVMDVMCQLKSQGAPFIGVIGASYGATLGACLASHPSAAGIADFVAAFGPSFDNPADHMARYIHPTQHGAGDFQRYVMGVSHEVTDSAQLHAHFATHLPGNPSHKLQVPLMIQRGREDFYGSGTIDAVTARWNCEGNASVVLVTEASGHEYSGLSMLLATEQFIRRASKGRWPEFAWDPGYLSAFGRDSRVEFGGAHLPLCFVSAYRHVHTPWTRYVAPPKTLATEASEPDEHSA